MAEHEIIIFGLHLNIDPVAFSIGDKWSVYWYGVIIAVGFALALIYGLKNAKRLGVDPDKMLDVILITTPLAVLCARAYYLLFDPNGGGIKSFSHFFGFDGSGFAGLAIYGGVIGAVVIGGIMCKVFKISVPAMFDIAALGFLIGQGVGRWGNFTNQEAFGCATGSDWWGMTSANVEAVLGKGQLAHPCFLYESIWCILGFVLLNIWSKKRKYAGQMALGYCVWYGIGRFFIEGLRTDSLYIGTTDIRVSQLLSALIAVFGAVMLIVMGIRRKIVMQRASYTPVFGELEDASVTVAANEAEGETEAEDEVKESDEAEQTEENEVPENEDN